MSLGERLRVAANNFNRAWDGSTCALMDEAANEIERLQRWQADANSLLNAWYDLAEELYEVMGKPPAFLGRSRVDLVRHALTKIPDVDTGADGNNNPKQRTSND